MAQMAHSVVKGEMAHKWLKWLRSADYTIFFYLTDNYINKIQIISDNHTNKQELPHG